MTDLNYHNPQDDVRTGTYLKAIMRNKHLFKGKVNIKLVIFIWIGIVLSI